MLADIGPGARVLESGVGSGALSMTMLRAGRRHRGLRAARGLRQPGPGATCAAFLGDGGAASATGWSCATATRASTTADVDRVVLDLPEPWQVVPHAEKALAPGGILCAYTPEHLQATQVREALAAGRVDRGPHARGAAPHLAHRGPGGAARPPHGGPHRLPHHRPLPGADARPTARAVGPGSSSVGDERPSTVTRLDEDALAGALLGGLDHGVEHAVGDLGHALGALRVALGRGVDLAALLDVGQARRRAG